MYDIHNQILVKGDNLEFLKHFRLRGVGAIFKNSFNTKKFLEIKERLNKQYPKLDVISGIEIHASKKSQIKKAIEEYRNRVEVILVDCKEPRAMRAASEMGEIDIISHAFVDQSAARECAKNNIALEINLKDLISVYGIKRANLISKIRFNLSLARKYKVPLILTTGADSIYDMRNQRQIIALAECIGFKHEEAKKALIDTPKRIIKTNREKISGKIIVEGVKRV